MTAWRIYYRKGRVFTSDDGAWEDAPADGVLAVVEIIGERRTIRSGGDYYRLERDGTVVVHETADAILHAIGHVELSAIKFGWCTTPTEMAQVFARIKAEG